jgi:hypothetical protein
MSDNQSIFKVSGSDRRILKKELHEKKYSHRMFHYYNDLNIVYGSCYIDDIQKEKEYLLKLENEIKLLEIKLLEKL